MIEDAIKISAQRLKQLCLIRRHCFDKNISAKDFKEGVTISLSLILADLKLMDGDIDTAVKRVIRDQEYGYYR